MSLNYTTVRLWWNGERGQAQCDGVERELRQVPTVEGVDIDQIDYAPELRCFLIKRKPYTGPADMEPPEIEAPCARSAPARRARRAGRCGRRTSGGSLGGQASVRAQRSGR